MYVSVPVCFVCTARHLWNINCSFLSWSGSHCSGPGGLLTCLQMLAHLHCAGRCPCVTCTYCFLVTDWLLMTFNVCPSLIASFVNEYLQAWGAGPLNDPEEIIDYPLLFSSFLSFSSFDTWNKFCEFVKKNKKKTQLTILHVCLPLKPCSLVIYLVSLPCSSFFLHY